MVEGQMYKIKVRIANYEVGREVRSKKAEVRREKLEWRSKNAEGRSKNADPDTSGEGSPDTYGEC